MAVLLDGHLRLDFSEPDDPRNDHLIFSKGHASPLYYSMLKAAGAIDDAELLTFRKLGSRLEGHPTPGPAGTDVATGSLGQGLPIAVGVAMAGKRLDRLPYRVWCLCGDSEMAEGSMWEAFQHAGWDELDNLIAIIDVNRLGQTRETMLGWDLDGYVRRIEAFGWHAIEIDGHDVDAIDAAYSEAERTDRPPDGDHRPHQEGQGRQGGRGPARQARQAARRPGGGDRRARRRARPVGAGRGARGRRAAPLRRLRRRAAVAGSSATRSRRARPTARRWPRSARAAATSSRSTARSRTRRTPRTSARRTRTATSRCSSPSSSWSPRPSACRCAAGCRSRRRSRRSSRARTTSSAWRRSRARTCACRARTPASRSARTARRRWRSRTSPRSARSTARPCCTRATPTRPRSSWPRWPTARASSSCARCAARPPVRTPAGEDVRIGGSRVAHDGDDVAIVACGITVDEAVEAAEALRRRRDRRARDRLLLGQADRRRGAAGGGARVRRDRHGRGPLARGRPRRRGARGAGRRDRCRSCKLAVREMPGSGTPDELLADAGIDAAAIAAAAKALVRERV